MNIKIEARDLAEIRKRGMTALLQELGPMGTATFLEQFDHGGYGDYTREKYEKPDLSIDEILEQRALIRAEQVVRA